MLSRFGFSIYKKASKIIPGGSQLLSKKPEIFLPDFWPSYYNLAKGCKIVAIDKNTYFDFTNCSVGMCPLGYANNYVNSEVKKIISKGNISTLNSIYEYKFAKLILKLHPWFHMARFTKSGGEAMSVAIRIARAYSNKNKILFCGYHGWHDWYLSANLSDNKNLNNHLLPEISAKGVPNYLKNSSIPFEFNNVDDFKKKFLNNIKDLACVVLEPARANLPSKFFLKTIRSFCTKNNIPLIFDEITIGWRVSNGGFHKTIKEKPDIAVFSKETSNGFPLGVVLGKKSIMIKAQESFISSAYWTENIGFVAGISMIKFFIKNNVSKILVNKGKLIKSIWQGIAKKYNIKINITGLDPLPVFSFDYPKSADAMMTYFTQEMLKEKILAHGSCFLMISHTTSMIKKYKSSFDKTFSKISNILKKDSVNFKDYLEGRVKFAKFKNPV
jgi:glutamate-1-semialdehyde aminotransferase